MFLRNEGVDGQGPVASGAYSSAKKRRFNPQIVPSHPNEAPFFGTSSYGGDSKGLARKREVARLFSRMRDELREIAEEFADDTSLVPSAANTVRKGILVEILVATEFVADELDCAIAALCQAGAAAKSRGATNQQIEKIARQARSFARLRSRMDEFQREVDSMVELTLRAFHDYQVQACLNFDPLSCGAGQPFVHLFLSAVGETVEVLSVLAEHALKNRDFETVTELCSCNLQLNNFLLDVQRILREPNEL